MQQFITYTTNFFNIRAEDDDSTGNFVLDWFQGLVKFIVDDQDNFLTVFNRIFIYFIILIWILSALKTFFDVKSRHKLSSYHYIIIFILCVILGPIGLISYLFLRPKYTKEELDFIKVEHKFYHEQASRVIECINCKHYVFHSQNFCTHCGTQNRIKCTNCEHNHSYEQDYCSNCGTNVQADNKKLTAQFKKKKSIIRDFADIENHNIEKSEKEIHAHGDEQLEDDIDENEKDLLSQPVYKYQEEDSNDNLLNKRMVGKFQTNFSALLNGIKDKVSKTPNVNSTDTSDTEETHSKSQQIKIKPHKEESNVEPEEYPKHEIQGSEVKNKQKSTDENTKEHPQEEYKTDTEIVQDESITKNESEPPTSEKNNNNKLPETEIDNNNQISELSHNKDKSALMVIKEHETSEDILVSSKKDEKQNDDLKRQEDKENVDSPPHTHEEVNQDRENEKEKNQDTKEKSTKSNTDEAQDQSNADTKNKPKQYSFVTSLIL